MSNIIFNESPAQASSLTSNIVEEKQSSQELDGAPSSEPRLYPVNNPSTNIDIDSSVNPNNCPECIQLQCTYLVYFLGQQAHSSFIPSDSTRVCPYTRSLKGTFSITMDFDLHQHRLWKGLTSVGTSNGPIHDPSFDSSPFMVIYPSDVPGLDPSLGPRNYPSSACPFIVPNSYPSMFFSLLPINDCGWVYRTNSNYYICYYQTISYKIYGINCYYIYKMNS